jgi:pimeloyl-ACP methyl ester carboxylesterase
MLSIFNQLTYSLPVKFIKISDYKIAYVDEGTSPNTLLFIHGLGSYLKAWERNIPELKKHFRCIALDLPGYGKSSKQIHSGEMSFYTDFLNKFITKLKIKNISLVGHSMGGQIAISFALKFPGQINKLILAAPAGFETFSDKDIEWILKIVSPQILYNTSDHQIRLNYLYNFYKMPAEAESMIADRIAIKDDEDFFNHCNVVSNSLYGLLKTPIFNRLNEIKSSVLIFYGLNDTLIPNRFLHQTTTKKIAEAGTGEIKNSKLILLNECGHFLQFEKPEAFNNEVISFFN